MPPELQNATLQDLAKSLMPEQLIRTHNRPQLMLPASGPREDVWRHVLRNIQRLKG